MAAQKTVLVVEDSEINRATLSGILSSEYRVLEAGNGREALGLLELHGEGIALILLDIVMPVMDGYTFLSIVKAHPDYASIPVIVTTQSDSEADEVAALSHGATDFVAKPYKAQIILHRAASIISLRETAAMINQFQYDRLTGLYSKEYFYQRVRETLRQNPEKEYDIVCSDIDNFKLINDIFGIPAGDRLLHDIAALYRTVIGDAGICGRLNADQFACLLERRTDYSDEMFVRVSGEVNALANARSIVMKWGIYTVEDRGVPVEQMCDRALLAARSIKGQYGKYFAAYDDQLRGKLLREQAIIDNMESALAQGQFQVYLQPKYRIRDSRLAGAEALVRWAHPEWGLQSPAEFIPLFERNGFITKLDRFVWDRSCSFLRKWDDAGLPSIPVSVNVSRADIYQADIAEILLGTVRKYGLAPARLHLEITESAYTEDPNQIIETAGRLRELGFVIEMDDFGSGYSSLNMLNRLPIDVLKLDMRFIQSETAKPVDQGILRFIMDLARWMELHVVAEGVETREQLERLREIDCDYVQGYYFVRPVPSEEFEKLLREEGTVAEQEPGAKRRRPVFLAADEDTAYRDLVRKTFEDLFQIVEAGTGRAALDCIVANRDKLAAVLLSATLPGSDGFSALEAVKRSRAVWSTPVIVTGPPDALLEEKALELGAEEYVDKPHTAKSLRRQVLRAMGTTASQEWKDSLQEEACRDYQTGLLNRRGFTAAAGALRAEDLPLAVCLFDLDDLKKTNDTFGHVEGDRLIEEFGALLRAHTRENDILSRYGGDEFVVVMRQVRSEEAALKKGGEICLAARKICAPKGAAAACTGGIVFSVSEEPVTELIARADRALYRAKAEGKGKCCLWKG
ncbi:EAL domain-containing protein [Anaerotruncus massiliensis (ex Liu et al. 2021)]|uniref:Stage 0 sporulation protein A homolog n=2 Tax=Anaerotruncus TaxID=244127 RepID=A0A498CXR0_9FIRM|nr:MULTISPECIES: EAL domain-containing protein [Anaerotruncus]MBC3937908.1 EAL domain-containing protein [Anaerotruncus massiliensis (ex Togo et al. 2019)]RLL13902.1 EAL domain-containing protein [Anaerotruncus massiliensis (ex Liu et al. 2021)]